MVTPDASVAGSLHEWLAHDPAERAPRARVEQLFQRAERRASDAASTAISTRNTDERVRVRRWSMISSDMHASETMKDLTSAPRMLVGGSFVFLDPNADVKKIKQLPSIRNDHGTRKPRQRTVSPEAHIPAVPRDTLPRDSVSRTKSLPFTVVQAAARFSSGTSLLKSRRASTASACSDVAEDFSVRRARVRSFSFSDAPPPTRVAGQKSVRVFAPSSRFGDPADWKKGSSVSLRRTTSSDSFDGGAAMVFQPVKPVW
ncbi:hypothetical protein T484DRAFT_1982858 [Baffinella frigidus]|nr:hypothetical protein T484DRAFT_1982858 [Cryptophyta sp. CCMP2293]|mmetsp:Transcript_64517/g.153879  ORF Transcript_64517/g.153879 Transcript_64517/m.153879 type:complete len:258 (+) Transcript_64517:108-881(+)|eukprot:CAMPEP_0180141246 /NCGR_PEP_ID=MMETSP0986-20121125/14768_1 /TAXON_ID=697907 /ORGANISM="non described non described, Strain CCMP2293" /LENGTH=257 /DNA_ID=CAMNT_0022084011 /DNA_START=40 /DNA_END=813 /DNA_ORIENTATION=+